METYSLGLALEDFVPVIFSAIGLWIVSQMIVGIDAKLGRMATIGAVLIAVGGLLKATWKLLMALTDESVNIVIFDKGMFVWMGVGFVLLSYAISYGWRVVYDRSPRTRIWLWPLVTIALFMAGGLATGMPDFTINTWRFIFLGMMTIGNVAVAVLLIRQAMRQGQSMVALFFLVNIVIVFILSGLARIPEQTIPLQWGEQILNTIGQGAFLYASIQLARGMGEARQRVAIA